MKFQQILNESFKRYRIVYRGSRKNYKINDPAPDILAIDEKYNVDGKGLSILGINLNYYSGDKDKIFKSMNEIDNKAGFRAFELKMTLRKMLSKDKDKAESHIIDEKKKRYETLAKEFPHLAKFIRRYKVSAIDSKKRK